MSAFDPLQTLDRRRIIASMRLTDYFAGQRLELHSPLPARAVAERINQAAGSVFWPFNTGVIGGVWAGHLRLRYRSSALEYNAKPVLSGRLQEAASGSKLEMRYRAPAWVYGFYVVWYLALSLIAVGLLVNGWAPNVSSGDKTMVFAVLLVLLAAPIGLHAFGTRRSEEELTDLIDFLGEHIEASV